MEEPLFESHSRGEEEDGQAVGVDDEPDVMGDDTPTAGEVKRSAK